MSRKLVYVSAVLLIFGLGYLAAMYLPVIRAPRVSGDWYQFPGLSGEKGFSYSTDALFSADLPLPNTKSVSGAAKFIEESVAGKSAFRLGYKLSVDVAPLDSSKVPEKYKKGQQVDIGGGKTVTALPVEQVTYEAEFGFILKDKDGFTRLELTSEKKNIASGKVNAFQDIATESVPVEIASKVASIEVQVHVVKCLTCDGR